MDMEKAGRWIDRRLAVVRANKCEYVGCKHTPTHIATKLWGDRDAALFCDEHIPGSRRQQWLDALPADSPWRNLPECYEVHPLDPHPLDRRVAR